MTDIDKRLSDLDAERKKLLAIKQEEKNKEQYEEGRAEADRLYELAKLRAIRPSTDSHRKGNIAGNFLSSLIYCDFWDDSRSWSLIHGVADRARELLK